ncbi:hypothetical protein BGX38DRAFT_1258030 [Terfezia claveryi]|nr:hypothetical protein BGX38DRAFT_1258030 [Terfezia claveryi]
MAEPTAMELDSTPIPTQTLFRPNKKRNYIRRARATSTSPDPPSSPPPKPLSIPPQPTSPAPPPLLPLPPPHFPPSNLHLTQSPQPTSTSPPSSLSAKNNPAQNAALTLQSSSPRFPLPIQPAGLRTQKMRRRGIRRSRSWRRWVAYIESQMEKRRLASTTTTTTTDLSTATNLTASPSTVHPSTTINNSAFWQPTRPIDRGATLGKLHEVDLGEENKLKNIHRTAEATRRLEDTTPTTTDDPQSSSKSRKRRRRNSQDIHRDKLVEEVLKESKLQVDLYDDAPSPSPHPSDEEGAADDRIAEKFRREFLDALMSRRRRRGNYQKTKKKDDAKKPRGRSWAGVEARGRR